MIDGLRQLAADVRVIRSRFHKGLAAQHRFAIQDGRSRAARAAKEANQVAASAGDLILPLRQEGPAQASLAFTGGHLGLGPAVVEPSSSSSGSKRAKKGGQGSSSSSSGPQGGVIEDRQVFVRTVLRQREVKTTTQLEEWGIRTKNGDELSDM